MTFSVGAKYPELSVVWTQYEGTANEMQELRYRHGKIGNLRGLVLVTH